MGSIKGIKFEMALIDDLSKANKELKQSINELSNIKQEYILYYESAKEIANKYKTSADQLGLDALKNTDYSSIQSLLSVKIK